MLALIQRPPVDDISSNRKLSVRHPVTSREVIAKEMPMELPEQMLKFRNDFPSWDRIFCGMPCRSRKKAVFLFANRHEFFGAICISPRS